MTARMLKAQQVQHLLGVDASTVYRMAGDGRLPAVRIGRQWRFPVEDIHALLLPPLERSGAADELGAGARPDAAPRLDPELIGATLDTVAPLLGVSMVVTDLRGHPLAPIVNPAPAITDRLAEPDFLATCTAEWAAFAIEPHLAPRFQRGRLGFLCAHSFVRSGASLLAMVLAGGVAAPGDGDPGLYHLDADRRVVVLDTLPKVAALLSRTLARPATAPSPDDA